MTRPINASLFVTDFLATGTSGEYTLVGAAFNNQADATNNGAGDVTVGFALYVQATDLSFGTPIPGVFHRYRFTAVTAPDSSTINGTIIWDEEGVEVDSPTPNSFAMLAQVTPKNNLSLLPMDSLYPGLPSGMTAAVLVLDNRDRVEHLAASRAVKLTGTTSTATNLVLGPQVPLTTLTNSIVTFRAVVTGRRTDLPNQGISLVIEGSAYVNSVTGLLTASGGTLTTVLSRDNPDWYATASVNSGLNTVEITVNGSASTSLNWSASLTTTIL